MDESVDRILESLAQVNVNLEGLRVSLAGLTEVKSDHEDRLRLIEQWKYSLSPLVTLIAFALGAVCNAALGRLLE
ncbi:hypothetical protein [Planctomicrobium piriforme]|uniref:Haemolysin XhlA n=1 Tax=Planctomicrobium piriforme TaxID=1576369 RepID=A0A1I3C1R7_9PLAN|nr:hypothetical protein [Planctomicrobium piriforme]SFH68548.1 hypothetical protein SAMN05421753_10252 [Planctomicrobium piriforme]